MVVIDTNVVSELMRLTPEPAVMAWFSRQDSADLYLIPPAGRRRDRLAAEVDAANAPSARAAPPRSRTR